jgi:hypothetical protein
MPAIVSNGTGGIGVKRIILAIAGALLIMTGCGSKETAMPIEMPSDYNFSVRYGYGDMTKNEINTYEDTVTKDLIMNGAATARLIISEDEMRDIYAKMREIDIMAAKKLPKKKGCFRTPSNEENWKITVNGETMTFAWTDEYCDMTEDANQLLELRKYIQNIVEDTEAYQALPEAEGGYD